MSKVIKLTEQVIQELQKDFFNAIKTLKLSDGKFTFTKSFGKVERKATLYYTDQAWAKQSALLREFDKEVAWHGVATRGDNPELDEYLIEDILVYPQEVTGATVTTDQEKYQTWLYEHDDDVFNNIRMQGHSHVNMGTSPSSVDLALYEKILSQLDDDMFYIFVIWNKRLEKTVKIYDLKKNVLFETEDVTVKVFQEEGGLTKFIEDAKELVVNKPITTGFSNFNSSKKEDKKDSATSDSKDDMKMGKKKDSKKDSKKETPNYSGYGWYGSGYSGGGHSSYYDSYANRGWYGDYWDEK